MILRSGFLVAFGVFSATAWGMPQAAIENGLYRVSLETAPPCLVVQHKATGKQFFKAVEQPTAEVLGKIAEVDDPVFGKGSQLEIQYSTGKSHSIRLFGNLPFVLIQTRLRNDDDKPRDERSVVAMTATLQLDKPAAELRTFGTGGLATLSKEHGSYAYLGVVDPASRSGVIGGWITHDRGSGVVLASADDNSVALKAQIDYGRLRLPPKMETALETFAVGYFEDARLGLEAYADAVARHYRVRLPHQPAGYCTWYADKYAGACDETHLAELVAYAAEHLKPFGFEFVQIDDHWQAGISKNGPKRNFTTHQPNGPYPAGMKPTADNIKRLGLTPGIWFMPFAGTYYDPYFENHPDWFAKTADGKPFETRWGGTCLDMTQPGAREHLRSTVQRIAHDWGYTIFKMDGLWTGTATRLMYVNNEYKWDEMGEALPADPNQTQIEAFRSGLKLVRETAGPNVYLLGCCVSQNMRSFGGSFGLLDAMRVGPDTGAGHIGAPHASRNYFLHGRVWHNDPDCVSVRAKTPLDQARVNASFTAITGNLFYNSDWIPDLPPERLDILKRTMLAHGLFARPVDLFENDPARIWLLTDARREPRRDVVALFNWDQHKPAAIECELSRIGLPAKKYVGFDFWANRFVPPFSEKLAAELPPASCRVLAVRPVAEHPQIVSTSRHVTQGMVDLLEEKWDPASKTLSGRSRMVANDPYELRIFVPVGEKSWIVKNASATMTGTAAMKAELRQDGPKIRIKITPTAGGEAAWSIGFETGRVDVPKPAPVADLKAAVDYGSVSLAWADNGAEAYRVKRSDGATFNVSVAAFCDASVKFGEKYRYEVSAIGWDGAASEPAAIEAATPAELKRPATPPKPALYLSDLKPLVAKNGWGKLGINQSIAGKTLVVDGKNYEKGLGAHAPSLIVYAIPEGAKRFVATVGLDDAKKTDPRSSVVFEVYGDVKEMGEPPVLLAKTPVLTSKTSRVWAFDLELNARFKELRLVVTDAGDGMNSDHADWVNAGFIR